MGRPHLRKLLLVTGTYKEEIGKNGVTSLAWSSWNIFVSTKRYRNGHFTVRNCLARKLWCEEFCFSAWFLKKKATSNLGCRLAAFPLLLLCCQCPAVLTELSACAQCPLEAGRAAACVVHGCCTAAATYSRGWEADLVWKPQAAWEEQRLRKLLSYSPPPHPRLMLTSLFCHLRLFIAYFTHITLWPCLEVKQGEDSWSVTLTCSTSINPLVKSQCSFTSVMSFYFITPHAVHEAVFPQCIHLVREKTQSFPSLYHQLPFWDQEGCGNASTA